MRLGISCVALASLASAAPALAQSATDGFGAPIATDQNWLFVGAPRETSPRGRRDGAFHIYAIPGN